MGSLSLERVDRLLWLGRYIERCYTTQRFILTTYDKALDATEGDWRGQLVALGFDAKSDDPISFFYDCLFDMGNSSSIAYSMSAAYGNAVRLRDALGTEAISYVQMANDSLEGAKVSDTALLDLQAVQDDIMAFKGCVDDFVADDMARNIVKCGMSIERIDLYARLAYRLDRLRPEVHRLVIRANRAGVPFDKSHLKALVDVVYAPDFPDAVTYASLGKLLRHVALVF